MNTTDEVLTATEAVKYLKTSKKSLFRLVEEGKVRGTKLGSHYRFLKRELDRFLLQGEQED